MPKTSGAALTAADTVALLDIDSAEVNLFVAATDSSVPTGIELRVIPINRGLAASFRDVFRKVARSFKRARGTAEATVIVDFDFDRLPESHEIVYIDLSHPDLQLLRQTLASTVDTSIIPEISSDDFEDFTRRMRFYIVDVSVGKSRVMLIRAIDKSMVMTRKRFIGRWLDSSGMVEFNEPFLVFDDNVHGVLVGDALFALQQTRLFNAVGFFKALEVNAEDGLKRITGVVPILDEVGFRDLVDANLAMRLKLARIARSPHIARVKLSDIKKTLKAFPHLKVQIGSVNGKPALDWSGTDAWELLRVFADDYLLSVMTGSGYETNSKTRVK